MKKALILTAAVLLLGSCATIINGRKQELSFDSNEKETQIFIGDKEVCRTPCIVEVARSRSKLLVRAKKTGFEDKTIFVTSSANVASLFNGISTIFSTFGLSTDMSSGAFWQYSPNSFYVMMQKEPKNAAEAKQRDRENKIRFFVLQNFGGLRTDVFSGGDQHEYLDALAEMTKLPKTDLRNIIENSDSEGECAERTIESYISNRKNGGH